MEKLNMFLSFEFMNSIEFYTVDVKKKWLSKSIYSRFVFHFKDKKRRKEVVDCNWLKEESRMNVIWTEPQECLDLRHQLARHFSYPPRNGGTVK
jgi:hypothetical protein